VNAPAHLPAAAHQVGEIAARYETPKYISPIHAPPTGLGARR